MNRKRLEIECLFLVLKNMLIVRLCVKQTVSLFSSFFLSLENYVCIKEKFKGLVTRENRCFIEIH